jgi:hypothetical protein
MKKTELTLKRAGVPRKKVVISELHGNLPEVGDVATIDGVDWKIMRVKEIEVIAEFSTAGGKLKQVFP